jgi:D-sedoheptulose 7-phosphate isomerase
MSASDIIRNNLQEASSLLDEIQQNERILKSIEEASEELIRSLNNDNKIISCGNGGSMSDAMHFAEELTGRFRNDRKPIAAISISDPSHISCTANDYGYEHVFSRFVEAVGNNGDVLLAISTSGNSKNIIKAAEYCRGTGIKVVALTGNDGGQLANLCDIEIRVPFSGYADRIQEVHIKVIHSLIQIIEENL